MTLVMNSECEVGMGSGLEISCFHIPECNDFPLRDFDRQVNEIKKMLNGFMKKLKANR